MVWPLYKSTIHEPNFFAKLFSDLWTLLGMHIQALPPEDSKRPFHCSRCPILPKSSHHPLRQGIEEDPVTYPTLIKLDSKSWMVGPFDFVGGLWQEIFRQVVTSIGSSSWAGLLTQLLLPLEERNKSCGYLEPLVDPHILVPRLHVPCWDVKQDIEVLPG